MWMWPNARISVMGGPQAASVLSTIKQAQLEAAQQPAWTAAEEATFKQPIVNLYEKEGHPYFASARCWDDGVIDPVDTRSVLALGLSAAMNAPKEDTRFGVFRM